MKNKILIGFIGQGYVGKNYADDFESRGFDVVRYSIERKFQKNKELIKKCDVVFIAVPTPTKNGISKDNVVREVIKLVGNNKIAVIKSTVLPDTAKSIQKEYPNVILLNSPEFLSESTASRDASKPFSNIVGITKKDTIHKNAAELVHKILPKSPYRLTCDSTEAEIIKYAHNGNGYVEIMFFNAMFDLSQKFKLNWNVIENALRNDPMISSNYIKPNHKNGRGAGGHCFIKDFSALSKFYKKITGDKIGASVFEAQEKNNIKLLSNSNKDKDIVEEVYGKKRKK